jgi:multiple sugar transport system ATP-binding protein
MANVSLKNVTKVFDNKVIAVKSLSLDIGDREFFVLVGPSGCGKSTILRLIAGLEEPTEGEIYIDDILVNDLSPRDRDVAMVFQNYALYPHMKAYDNLSFALRLRRQPKPVIDSKVKEAASILGIENLLPRKPSELSGGESQRVAVGRAIVRAPKVFLFDEPLSNLDAKLRVQMRAEIKRLHRNLGATMIYVTHDQIEAMTMGERIVVLNEGEAQQIDTPLNLYYRPENLFVAGFIGNPPMNFIRGNITSNNGYMFVSEDIKVPPSSDFIKQLTGYEKKEVILGVRPEDIYEEKMGRSLLKSKTLSKDPIRLIVDFIELMGNESLIYAKAGDNSLIVRAPADTSCNRGKNINVYFDLGKLHWFDSITGKRIEKQ